MYDTGKGQSSWSFRALDEATRDRVEETEVGRLQSRTSEVPLGGFGVPGSRIWGPILLCGPANGTVRTRRTGRDDYDGRSRGRKGTLLSSHRGP